jgi:predicted CXXCH cytochrome family protein
MKEFRFIGIIAVCTALILPGCDAITRHKVASTIFDGVPTLPPPEQFCEEYAIKRVTEVKAEIEHKETKKGPTGSSHLPYQDKQCDDCHDKMQQGGLIKPKNELCYVCHTNFIKGTHVHGPVATADCLACHEPHTSTFPRLLKSPPEKVCVTCHREKRVAAAMHDKFVDRQLHCIECHDPHYGNAQFFLK